ncbi:MAG TPA: hypothetical protein QF572_22505 [Vicinamibacterales bacterium]|jgi:hypothetical protein|nr:hypothetical protein [Vicinamibacterales bacterium]|tara:strand:+ start:2170 stop:2484 length:315 start_codon:yes stop_codon:yes gene_type:complete
MDVARPDIARAKRLRRIVYGTGSTVVVLLITVGVSRLESAAPRVEQNTVFIDVVQRVADGFTDAYRVEVPRQALEPGAYVLTVEARDDVELSPVSRDVAFTVFR